MEPKNTKEKLLYFIEEIEKQIEAKQDILDTIKSFYEEAKSSGFDIKALKKLIRMRKQDAKQREQEQEILTVYMHVLGMLKDSK
jgi:uncharacterized protein (UPF0335 family)